MFGVALQVVQPNLGAADPVVESAHSESASILAGSSVEHHDELHLLPSSGNENEQYADDDPQTHYDDHGSRRDPAIR